MIGGRHEDEILRDVWILNPETGEWREGPAMPEPMELLGAAVAGDEIHAVWESTYQIYDAATGGWRDGPRSLVTRHGLQTFYLDGLLVTVGGLHDAAPRQPGRGASRPPCALTSAGMARLSNKWPPGQLDARPFVKQQEGSSA